MMIKHSMCSQMFLVQFMFSINELGVSSGQLGVSSGQFGVCGKVTRSWNVGVGGGYIKAYVGIVW